jgi:hypothetical protein
VIDSAPLTTAPTRLAILWSLVKLPLQIVITGLAVLLLFWVSTLFHIPWIDRLTASISGKVGPDGLGARTTRLVGD